MNTVYRVSKVEKKAVLRYLLPERLKAPVLLPQDNPPDLYSASLRLFCLQSRINCVFSL